jgi:Homeodomain-like domain-containing protein
METPQDEAGPSDDEVLLTLQEAMAALRHSTRRNRRALAQAEAMARQRTQGRAWRDIVQDEDGPLVVELMSESLGVLIDAGARLRRAKARALHREGVTMDAIAELFGVTRQRVSHLIRAEEDGTPPRSKRRGH